MLKKIFVSLLLLGTMANATAPTKENVTQLYIATFDRAPDAPGLAYWLNDSMLELEGIASSFFYQEETKRKYPVGFSNANFIQAIYTNLFKRQADHAGFEYWNNELEIQNINRSILILAIIDGALGDDDKILSNKLTVGLKFVEDSNSDIKEAHNIMIGITEDPVTVNQALCEYDVAGCYTPPTKPVPDPGDGEDENETKPPPDDDDDAPIVIPPPASNTNKPPSAVAPALTRVALGDSTNITLTGTDPDGDELTFIIISQPTKGDLNISALPIVKYTADKNKTGSDNFTFKVNDGKLDSAPATALIDITLSGNANIPPVAIAQNVQVFVNTETSITLEGTDADGDNLEFNITTQPTKGTLDISALPIVKYTSSEAAGADSFAFTVFDGTVNSQPAEVTLNIIEKYDAIPIADKIAVINVDEDGISNTIHLSGTDAEDDDNSLTVSIVIEPTKGTLEETTTPSYFLYKPNPNATGDDSFSFRVTDSAEQSSTPSVVSIIINPVNDKPVAESQSGQIYAINSTDNIITLTAKDENISALTYYIESNTTNGTMDISALPIVKYTPTTDYNGTDSFTFHVIDSENLQSDSATIEFKVEGSNATPIAISEQYNIREDDQDFNIDLNGTDLDPDDTLEYSIVTEPTKGTLEISSLPNISYTPFPDANGEDSFTFKVNDGKVDSAHATITLVIASVNDSPVANTDTISVVGNSSVEYTLTGSDVDSDKLTYSIKSQPTKGTLDISALPLVIYTPTEDMTDKDSFTFAIKDGDNAVSEPATIFINITASGSGGGDTNTPPVATPHEDINVSGTTTSEEFTLTGTDKEDVADSLKIIIVTQPQNGTLDVTQSPIFTYTATADKNGTDSFTFKVEDTNGEYSTEETVNINITASGSGGDTNNAPVATSKTVTVSGGTATSITIEGTDADNDTLTYYIESNTTNGTLTGQAPNMLYTPNADENGTDSFTFTVNDGQINSNIAKISINIIASGDFVENTAPVAYEQNVTVSNDSQIQFTLDATDADGDNLTYAVTNENNLNGTITISGADVNYTADINFVGHDILKFTANDGTIDSNIADVNITVTDSGGGGDTNTPPVANDKNVTVSNTDGLITLTLDATDAEDNNSNLVFSIVDGSTTDLNGTLSGFNGADINYTANANFVGYDTFKFIVTDTNGTASEPADVNITVTGVVINTTPVATAQMVLVDENATSGSVNITLSGTDADGNTELNSTIVLNPLHGTLNGILNGSINYTPNDNYHGTDSFTFTVTDGTLTSTPATIDIMVTNINTAPANLSIGEYQTYANGSRNNIMTLSATDLDGDKLIYTVDDSYSYTSGNSYGTPPNIVYTPSSSTNDDDGVVFTVSDGIESTTSAYIYFDINGTENETPIAEPKTFDTVEDTNLTIYLIGSDNNSTDLTYTIETNVSHGTLSKITGTDYNRTLQYKPDGNYTGEDSFTFKIYDGLVDSAHATISINVTPSNDVPVAKAQSGQQFAKNSKDVVITLMGIDVDDDNLTYHIADADNNISNGILSEITGTENNMTVRYTPDSNYTGEDEFGFYVTDGEKNSSVAIVKFTVFGTNAAPSAESQTVSLTENNATTHTKEEITLGGSDANTSDTLTYTIVVHPLHGVLSATDSGSSNTINYEPHTDYNGTDRFMFKVNDGKMDSPYAEVNLTIDNTATAPVAQTQIVMVDINGTATFTLVGLDPDSSSLDYNVSSKPADFNGTLSSIYNTNDINYTADTNFSGVDAFIFTVKDDADLESNATVIIIVD